MNQSEPECTTCSFLFAHRLTVLVSSQTSVPQLSYLNFLSPTHSYHRRIRFDGFCWCTEPRMPSKVCHEPSAGPCSARRSRDLLVSWLLFVKLTSASMSSAASATYTIAVSLALPVAALAARRHSPLCSQAVDHLWSPLHAIGFFLHVVAEFVSRERHSRESKVQLQALDTAMLFGYVAQSTRSASGPIHPSLLHVVREEAWQTLGTASGVLIFRPMSTQKAAVRQEKSAHRPRSTWRAREAAAPEAAAWMPARWVASSSS